jgi:hypothetical protein
MRRNTELGVIRLKTILGVLVVGVACYVAAKVFAPYFANSQLQDKMYQEARFAQTNDWTTEQMRDVIYREAQSCNIPLHREDIQVENSASGTRITADYTVTVDLHFYQLSLHFHPTSVR